MRISPSLCHAYFIQFNQTSQDIDLFTVLQKCVCVCVAIAIVVMLDGGDESTCTNNICGFTVNPQKLYISQKKHLTVVKNEHLNENSRAARSSFPVNRADGNRYYQSLTSIVIFCNASRKLVCLSAQNPAPIALKAYPILLSPDNFSDLSELANMWSRKSVT